MQMKKLGLALATLVAGIGLSATAMGAPVTLDTWVTSQNTNADAATPMQTNHFLATVLGVADMFGSRTVGAVLTSANGTVGTVINGGLFQCNRSVEATGHCFVEYAVTQAFTLSSVTYVAINDGAFGGAASLVFYNGLTQLASQSIAMGTASYETMLNASWLVGDTFRMASFGTIAVDQGQRQFQGNLVPEPGSLALAGLGLFGLGLVTSRRNRPQTTA